jgi:hypothetical protein
MLPSNIMQSQNEAWRPNEINELDEMERMHALKQRENLLKGMGVVDFVNKILVGTPGTLAVPPAASNQNNCITGQNNTNLNLNQNNHFLNSNPYNVDDLLSQANLENKARLELKTKYFNPFENHPLFAEVIIKS